MAYLDSGSGIGRATTSAAAYSIGADHRVGGLCKIEVPSVHLSYSPVSRHWRWAAEPRWLQATAVVVDSTVAVAAGTAAVVDGTTAATDFTTAVELHRLVDAIKQASDEGREVTIE